MLTNISKTNHFVKLVDSKDLCKEKIFGKYVKQLGCKNIFIVSKKAFPLHKIKSNAGY